MLNRLIRLALAHRGAVLGVLLLVLLLGARTVRELPVEEEPLWGLPPS